MKERFDSKTERGISMNRGVAERKRKPKAQEEARQKINIPQRMLQTVDG